jgi:peptidoglycan/xylan/chitin deacetylase (PgdA/CDA1 family)
VDEIGRTRIARPVTSRFRALVSKTLIGKAHIERSLDPDEGTVALTFDDGPDPVHTPAILDELSRLGVPATFFVVGSSAHAHPDLVRRILADGHAVGSHSDSHPEPWRLRVDELAREYRRGRARVEQAAGRPVRLFRPPKGYLDGRGAAAMLLARVRPWLWTIDPCDWEPDASADDIVAGVSALRAGDVVLLHDAIKGPISPSALDRSATCAALAGIANIARASDLRFVTLS